MHSLRCTDESFVTIPSSSNPLDRVRIECHIGKVKYYPTTAQGIISFLKLLKVCSFTKRIQECQQGQISYDIEDELDLPSQLIVKPTYSLDDLHTFFEVP